MMFLYLVSITVYRYVMRDYFFGLCEIYIGVGVANQFNYYIIDIELC
jgi:hypothetical protein